MHTLPASTYSRLSAQTGWMRGRLGFLSIARSIATHPQCVSCHSRFPSAPSRVARCLPACLPRRHQQRRLQRQRRNDDDVDNERTHKRTNERTNFCSVTKSTSSTNDERRTTNDLLPTQPISLPYFAYCTLYFRTFVNDIFSVNSV